MNDVIVIYEECHGDIGIAADYKNAIYYLISQGWIDDYTDIFDNNEERCVPIAEALGEKWRTILLDMNEKWFNNAFVDTIKMCHYSIYKHE